MGSRDKTFDCIALDMGAASIRLMHGRIEGKRIRYRELRRFRNNTEFREGRERWKLDGIVREVRKGIEQAVAETGVTYESIGVDSWGADYVLLDGEDKPVEPAVSYRDVRTRGMREQWIRRMSEEETFRRTGINYNVFNTLYQLLAARESGELEQASRILFMPGYMHHVLSGTGKNELTISSTSQMLRAEDNTWDPEILGCLQLDPVKLGDVVEPGTILGSEIHAGKKELAMANVAVCGHDTASVVVSIPSGTEDFAFISAGTWCIVGIESPSPLLSREALKLGITNERGYGHSYRALKNITGLWLMQGLKNSLPKGYSYARMERMIREGTATNLVILPEDPLFFHPGDMKTAFDEFFRKTGQDLPGEFSGYLQCAYDSLCFAFRYYLEKLEFLSGRPVSVIHVLGGGSQSDYLNQRIATICERKVISGPVEGAALGNILVQALALERIGELSEGKDLVRGSCQVRTCQPEVMDRQLKKRYDFFLGLKNG